MFALTPSRTALRSPARVCDIKVVGGVRQLRRYQVPRRGTISLAVGETHGQRPSNPNPYRPRRGRTFSLSVGGKPHSTPAGLAEHRGSSFPWVSPTANDIGPLRGPPPGSGGKAHPSTSMSHTPPALTVAAWGVSCAITAARSWDETADHHLSGRRWGFHFVCRGCRVDSREDVPPN